MELTRHPWLGLVAFVGVALSRAATPVAAFQLTQARAAGASAGAAAASSSRAFSRPTLGVRRSSPGDGSEEGEDTSAATKWSPQIDSLEDRRSLRNGAHQSERICTIGFHHVEFICGDAKSTATRFSLALGMPITCVTGQMTGNDQCISYGLQSGDVRFLFTAPYAESVQQPVTNDDEKEGAAAAAAAEDDDKFDAPRPLPSFDAAKAHEFFRRHGLAAGAVGVEVRDAREAFEGAMAGGAKAVLEPTVVAACGGIQKMAGSDGGGCTMAEVELYGDVKLRFVSFDEPLVASDADEEDNAVPAPFLPHLSPLPVKRTSTYGLRRIDHAVGNVPDLFEAAQRVKALTGFHDFAEFTAEDVGTVDSGLNSVVLASDTEDVLLPLNEPTEGRRKSQIQTYLEQNQGPGLQHLALKTDDIFNTISKMRIAEEELGGFELMVRPSDAYYRGLPERLGDQLTEEQYRRLEELGVLADADDEGVLLQVFTKPVGDRPTFFVEIIQRIGCKYRPDDDESEEMRERPGCGGFGQGNFRELFKAIEDHEKTLKV